MLAGCGSSVTTASSSSTSASSEVSSTDPHNSADVVFAQMMVVHHKGAVAMADLAATRAGSDSVKTLAAQIKAAQAPEIAQMRGWLAAWNSAPSTSGMGMAMGSAMPGMMSDAQMSVLTAASGAAFDKLFLQLMIVHHQGALAMAKTEQASGENPDAEALATSIISGQTAQISQMQTMLAAR